MDRTKNAFITVISALAILTGCAPATVTPPPFEPIALTLPLPSASPQLESITAQSVTQNNLSGNHIISGSINIQAASVIDVHLEGKPAWIVGAPLNDGVIFVVVTEDGKTQAYQIAGGAFEVIEITPSQLPAGMPPLLTISNGTPQLVSPPNDASTLTNPILLDKKAAYITSSGDLMIGETRLPVNALPDSRILADTRNRLLVLSQPTDRYDHGVLGDSIEASGITLIETDPEIKVVHNISIEEPDVIEGISAIWADVNNDERQDIIVTLSNNQSGARLVAYNEDGTILAESDPIGLGHRWRHQLAVAQFEANIPPLLVSVRTPHIGGIVEFFQYKVGKLEIVKEFNGFSTHSIGSRNLDSAIAADFNNDGIFELLIPDQSHTELGIISMNEAPIFLSLDGILTSNLSAVNTNGKLYIAAGTQNKLRIWIP